MLRYLIRRTIYAIPIMFGVFLVTFALFYLTVTPEQMARRNISAKNPTPQQIEDWLKEHGYDKPRGEQFVQNMKELMLFQFGKSDATQEDIGEMIRQRVWPSLTIGGLIFLAALITDVGLALFFAYFRGTYIDVAGTLVCVVLMSVSYLVYLIAGQYALAKVLKYFPIAGWGSGLSAAQFIWMPLAIGVISGLGQHVRLYRTFIVNETNQDYVRTARAKGVPEQKVLFLHVLKNAAIPILTSLVATIPLLLMGSLLLESFFGIPGIGGMTFDAIRSADFAVVRAMVFYGSVLYIIGFMLTDISYALVDPRVRLE
jgi:peptide/nickel transport system permease protein